MGIKGAGSIKSRRFWKGGLGKIVSVGHPAPISWRPLRCSQFSRRGAWPKGQDLVFFVAAVRTFERVNGRVADGRVKIDDGVSYGAAACRADVIDGEVHVRFLSLQANGGPSRGSAKIVMLLERSGALPWRLNRTTESRPYRAICRDLRARLSTDYPQISTA
jgi:hypothetical protein